MIYSCACVYACECGLWEKTNHALWCITFLWCCSLAKHTHTHTFEWHLPIDGERNFFAAGFPFLLHAFFFFWTFCYMVMYIRDRRSIVVVTCASVSYGGCDGGLNDKFKTSFSHPVFLIDWRNSVWLHTMAHTLNDVICDSIYCHAFEYVCTRARTLY